MNAKWANELAAECTAGVITAEGPNGHEHIWMFSLRASG